MSRISFVKVQIFNNTPVAYFVHYFRAKCREIAHFRVALSLSIKARPGAHPFI